MEQALALLDSRTRDEDKFVGLLLLARLLRPDDAAAVRKAFEAMDFGFLARLLQATDASSSADLPSETLHEIAASILSSFCIYEELAASNRLVPLLKPMARLLATKSESESVLDDIFMVFTAMASSVNGRALLLEQIPRGLSWVCDMIPATAARLRARKDAKKFDLLSLMNFILSAALDSPDSHFLDKFIPTPAFIDDSREAIQELLRNKLDSSVRIEVFRLVSLIFATVGPEQLLLASSDSEATAGSESASNNQNQNSGGEKKARESASSEAHKDGSKEPSSLTQGQLIMLLLHLCGMELRVHLDRDPHLEKDWASSPIVQAIVLSVSIMEACLPMMEEAAPLLGWDAMIKLRAVFVESFATVVDFLIDVQGSRLNPDDPKDVLRNPAVRSVAKALLAFMVEDNESFAGKTDAIMPLLRDLANVSDAGFDMVDAFSVVEESLKSHPGVDDDDDDDEIEI